MLAGCGGGGTGDTTASVGETQTLRGPGYTVSVPSGWQQVKSRQGLTLAPEPGSQTLVSIVSFRLVRRFRLALWPRARAELDRVAAGLARSLGGRIEARDTLQPGTRQYVMSYEHEGTKLRQRITLVLRDRLEYELLCRWKADDAEPAACAEFLRTFRPS
jgi:hypothetical protein